jgi:uncharacterized protein (DUF362 family)
MAQLVRSANPSGKILVMEGSTENTTEAFQILGYTTANFGTTVDEFIALEGSSCSNRGTAGLVQKSSIGGKLHWANERYLSADVVISIGVLKTHKDAGITGAVKNLGIGATPASQYSNLGCSRTQSPEYIDHRRAGIAQFIHDFYSLRKADFAVIDGLQGMQNGPNPLWLEGADYETDKMNMRLIMAGRDAVAVDTVAAVIMGCRPRDVDYLVMLETDGLGVADPSKIRVVGKSIEEVQKDFKGPDWACGTP